MFVRLMYVDGWSEGRGSYCNIATNMVPTRVYAYRVRETQARATVIVQVRNLESSMMKLIAGTSLFWWNSAIWIMCRIRNMVPSPAAEPYVLCVWCQL